MKLENIIVVSTFFALWIAVMFEDSIQQVIAYLFILSFGILHGANDLTLIQKSSPSHNSAKGYLTILFYYVLFVLASLGLFYIFPALALLSFVLFSGYHFGEQHFVSKTIKPQKLVLGFYIFYGLFVLLLLFYTNPTLTTDIVRTITQYSIPSSYYGISLLVTGIATLISGVLCIIANSIKINIVKEVFFLIVFFIVFKTASLLWGFAIYFILWHSIPSLMDQMLYLHGNVNKTTFISFIKKSFPYWLISIIGLGLILFIFRGSLETTLAFFFSFLAAITFPHVLVIKRLNHN